MSDYKYDGDSDRDYNRRHDIQKQKSYRDNRRDDYTREERREYRRDNYNRDSYMSI